MTISPVPARACLPPKAGNPPEGKRRVTAALRVMSRVQRFDTGDGRGQEGRRGRPDRAKGDKKMEEEIQYWRKVYSTKSQAERDEDRIRLFSRIAGVDRRGRFDQYNPLYRVLGPQYEALRLYY